MINRQGAFEREFKELLRKYNVEMSPIEGWCGYAVTCDGVNFYSPAQYDEYGDLIGSHIDSNFGRFEDGK